jgi:hypothetical protein
MTVNNEDLEAWMKRIWEKLESLEDKINRKEKVRYTVDGELLLDNQDLCFMLNVSKRTLQRFRSAGFLPCRRIDQKTFYLESEVLKFIREHLKPTGKDNPKDETS